MFCVLRYISWENMNSCSINLQDYILGYISYKRCLNESTSTLRSVNPDHADPQNLELYFNPNCILQLILSYICDEANLSLEGDFDLCNEAGDLLGVKDYNPTIEGTLIFKPREIYYVVIAKLNRTDNKTVEFIPLLNPVSSENLKLKKLLKKYAPTPSTSFNKKRSISRNSISRSWGSNSSATKSKSTHKRRSSAI